MHYQVLRVTSFVKPSTYQNLNATSTLTNLEPMYNMLQQNPWRLLIRSIRN